MYLWYDLLLADLTAGAVAGRHGIDCSELGGADMNRPDPNGLVKVTGSTDHV